MIVASLGGFLWDWVKAKATPVTATNATNYVQHASNVKGNVTQSQTVYHGDPKRTFEGVDLAPLEAALSRYAGTVFDISWLNADEPRSFGEEIRARLKRSGWRVHGVRTTFDSSPPMGVQIGVLGPLGAFPEMRTLHDCLVSLGFAAHFAQSGSGFRSIYVGRRV
jgi:hypothetical protein